MNVTRPLPQSPGSGPSPPISGTGGSIHIGGREEMSGSRIVLRERLEHAMSVHAQRLALLRQFGAEGDLARGVAETCSVLGMLLEGLDEAQIPDVPESAVGYGSLVATRDQETGRNATYRIMSGGALDLDAGHISLDSALGSALVGMSVGAEVEAYTPAGRRCVHIIGLQTVHSFLDQALARAERGVAGLEPRPSNLEEVSS